MRYGILADIHANLEALEAAFTFLAEQEVDDIVCLGDIVGYNANPKECLDQVRARCSTSIKGNHERMVLGGSLAGVRQETLDATEWTRNQLSDEDLAYLGGLGDTAPLGDGVLLVHGSPRDPDEYILSTDAIRDNMDLLKREHPAVKVCFFGHSHFPMIIGLPEIHTRFHETKTVALDPARLYLVNPGSVGQPRDSCPLSSFAIFDTDRHAVTIYRRPYDVTKTQEKILAAGLHERLASRLERGK